MRAPRLPRLRWRPRRPDWHAILTLQRPRRAQLRTRVLAGVLAITVIALVAFDFAAVGALRRYLLGHTDAQLATVLGLYRPMTITLGPDGTANWYVKLRNAGFAESWLPPHPREVPAGLRPRPGGPRVQQVLYGPHFRVPAPILAQFGVGFVGGQARPVELIGGNPGLVPRIPPGQMLRLLSANHNPRSVISADGAATLRLGAALNGMLTRIEVSVSEREASQELTRRFFADASHELRNPLASLRANAELYQQGVLREPHQVDEAMRRIAHEAQRMSSLVDDMLRLARLDQQPGQNAEPVDVSALVTECAERAEITDPERAWHTDIAPGLSSTGDEELLRRAVDNLLANIRAHTPRDTTATLTAAQCNGSITIEVSDDGPGVPPDQLARIFDRFYRTGQGCLPGSGLGLAIVNAVAATHNGTAQASLNDPHGLRITLTLPAAGAAPADPAAPVPHTVSAPR